MHIGFWWESKKERNSYEDLNFSGRIILKWILQKGMDWIHLAEDWS
jgi:hypothetical protein